MAHVGVKPQAGGRAGGPAGGLDPPEDLHLANPTTLAQLNQLLHAVPPQHDHRPGLLWSSREEEEEQEERVGSKGGLAKPWPPHPVLGATALSAQL